MSESDGLQKLTAFLNQTRRQAEAAVDALNLQIEDLRKENELYSQLCNKLEQEKDHFKSMAEQLKQGGTTKQMLQERDDWRALIDNVQKDRARLQEECCVLEANLDAANEEITNLKDEIEQLRLHQQGNGSSTGGTPQRSSNPSPNRSTRTPLSIQCDENEEESGGDQIPSPLISPVLDRNGCEVALNFSGPPQQVIRQLQIELKRAYAQLNMERQQAEAERLSYQLELSRLQQQQQRIGQPFVSSQSHPHHYPHPATSRTYVLGGRDNNGTAQLFPAFASGLNGGVGVNSKGAGAQPGRQAKGWLNPLGYIDYWFGDSTGSSGGAAAGGSGETIIIKV